jgi:acyl carrier protein
LKCGNRTATGLGEPVYRRAGRGTSASNRRRPAASPKIVEDANGTKTWTDLHGIDWVAANEEVGAMSDIGERVKKIVVEHLGVEPDKVTENASFIDDLGADSLDTVELVMAFEEEFGCEIPDDAAETILTVGDAVKFLEKNAKS